MVNKIVMLVGFFVSFCLGAFGAITNITIMTNANFATYTSSERLQVISFLIAFILIALASLMLFVTRLLRLLTDIRINKENK